MKRFLFGRKQRQALIYSDVKQPSASRWNVVIRIHASSVNPHDWQYYNALKLLYKLSLPLPRLSLGHDISGVVVDVGSAVKNIKVGDEVFTMSAKTGAFGEYLSVNQWMVAPKPQSVCHTEAATVPMVGLTSWQMFILCKLKAGDTLLLNGASGGVGVHALQIAKARGARVTTVCSTRNLELVKTLGADETIDYTQQDVQQIDEPFDVVFDTVGTLSPLNCAQLVKPQGYFATTMLEPKTLAAVVLSRIPLRRFIGLGHLRKTVTLLAIPIGKHVDILGKMIDNGELTTVVDKIYPIEQLNDALDYSQTGRARGKIALQVISEDTKPE